jgi:hypothetical protein
MSFNSNNKIGYLINLPAYYLETEKMETALTNLRGVIGGREVRVVVGLNQTEDAHDLEGLKTSVEKVKKIAQKMNLEQWMAVNSFTVTKAKSKNNKEKGPPVFSYIDMRNKMFLAQGNDSFYQALCQKCSDVFYMALDVDTHFDQEVFDRVEDEVKGKPLEEVPLVVAGHYDFSIPNGDLFSGEPLIHWDEFLGTLTENYQLDSTVGLSLESCPYQQLESDFQEHIENNLSTLGKLISAIQDKVKSSQTTVQTEVDDDDDDDDDEEVSSSQLIAGEDLKQLETLYEQWFKLKAHSADESSPSNKLSREEISQIGREIRTIEKELKGTASGLNWAGFLSTFDNQASLDLKKDLASQTFSVEKRSYVSFEDSPTIEVTKANLETLKLRLEELEKAELSEGDSDSQGKGPSSLVNHLIELKTLYEDWELIEQRGHSPLSLKEFCEDWQEGKEMITQEELNDQKGKLETKIDDLELDIGLEELHVREKHSGEILLYPTEPLLFMWLFSQRGKENYPIRNQMKQGTWGKVSQINSEGQRMLVKIKKVWSDYAQQKNPALKDRPLIKYSYTFRTEIPRRNLEINNTLAQKFPKTKEELIKMMGSGNHEPLKRAFKEFFQSRSQSALSQQYERHRENPPLTPEKIKKQVVEQFKMFFHEEQKKKLSEAVKEIMDRLELLLRQ